jgi:hypothetical protein
LNEQPDLLEKCELVNGPVVSITLLIKTWKKCLISEKNGINERRNSNISQMMSESKQVKYSEFLKRNLSKIETLVKKKSKKTLLKKI